MRTATWQILIFISGAKVRTQLTSWPDPAWVGSTPRVDRVPVRTAYSRHCWSGDLMQFPVDIGTRPLGDPFASHSRPLDSAPWFPDMDSRGWRSWSTSSVAPSRGVASHLPCWRRDSWRDHSTVGAQFQLPLAADFGRWSEGGAGKWGWSCPPAEQPSRWALCDVSWLVWNQKWFINTWWDSYNKTSSNQIATIF